MAINKTVNKRTMTHGAMKNCISYVLQDGKIKDQLVYVTGPFLPEKVNTENVYRAFLNEKEIWRKDSGRMYAHNIISFHKEEEISPEEALLFGIEFAENWFPKHQSLVGVHQDKDHVHIHLITNTVSYVDGKKLHTKKEDMQKMKDFTNRMCLDRGLSIAEKGRHFDGTKMEEGEIKAWSKDKYQLVSDSGKPSYLADCAMAVLESLEGCCSRELFFSRMKEKGWEVLWSDNRKYITFKNEEGKRVRHSNLNNTFSMNLGKEELDGEFIRQNEKRQRREQEAVRGGLKEHGGEYDFGRYYEEVEAAIFGGGSYQETVGSNQEAFQGKGYSSAEWETGGPGDDTEDFLRKLAAKEQHAEAERRARTAERRDREAARERSRIQEESGIGERKPEPERRSGKSKGRSTGSGLVR